MKLIDRYILGELIGPAFFGMMVFSSLWLVNVLMKVIDMMVTKEVAFSAVARFFLYTVPVVMTTSCPMAMLLASLMAVGRITSDSELTAMKAGGLSVYRVLAPVTLVGLIASGFVFWLNEWVVPETNQLRNKVYLNEIVLKKPLPKVAQNIFFEGGKEFKMFVRSYEPKANVVHNATVFHFQAGAYPRITEAKTALLAETYWDFRDGTMYTTRPTGQPEHFIHFGNWRYPLDLSMGDPIKDVAPRPGDQPLPELWHYIKEQEAKGMPTTTLWMDFWWKTAFPCASLFLMLLGGPLAAGSGRSGAGLGIGLSILLMFAYYMLLALCKGFGENGSMAPFVAAWLPNCIVFMIAIWLTRRAAR
jgi:lipopolysaccharide export system permease protein